MSEKAFRLTSNAFLEKYVVTHEVMTQHKTGRVDVPFQSHKSRRSENINDLLLYNKDLKYHCE